MKKSQCIQFEKMKKDDGRYSISYLSYDKELNDYIPATSSGLYTEEDAEFIVKTCNENQVLVAVVLELITASKIGGQVLVDARNKARDILAKENAVQ